LGGKFIYQKINSWKKKDKKERKEKKRKTLLVSHRNKFGSLLSVFWR
jgi:hypothetical protein